MRGSAAFRAAVAPGGVLAGPWARNDLWRRARAVPSLDLRFAENKSLVDATTGQNLVTFTRASSGTYVGSDGLIKTATTNEARFDHNPTTGESLGLLVEEQRTNLLLQSENFGSFPSWLNFGTTEASVSVTNPAGGSTAWKLAEDSTTGEHGIYQTTTTTGSNSYSVFAKAAERRYMVLRKDNTSLLAVFDLQTGAITQTDAGVTASIVAYPNGWYRCTITCTSTGNSVIKLSDVATGVVVNSGYAGNGTSGIYLWGAQLEAGAFPTSYIPTTTAAVTRSADVASITGTAFSSWYRQDEGTVFWESALIAGNPPASSFPGYWSLNNGTGANQITGYALSATSNRMYVRESGTVYADITMPTFVAAAFAKSAGVYKVNDVAATTNGGTVGVDTTVPLPISDRLTIGAQATAAPTNGTIRRLTYWPQRLSNPTLQTITQP